MSQFKIGRRMLLTATGGALAMPWVARAQGDAVKVSIGRIPWAAFNSPMTQYMIENKLFEKRANELGLNLTIDWRDYPTALPMVAIKLIGSLLEMARMALMRIREDQLGVKVRPADVALRQVA